jgi:hypothetical protein
MTSDTERDDLITELAGARRAMLHVVTETARHAGHADLLRETLDGRKST